MLIEVERKGLSSTFAFFCSNKKCDDQTLFYSSDVATASNNLTVHCVNHLANLAIRSLGRGRSLSAQRTLKGRQKNNNNNNNKNKTKQNLSSHEASIVRRRARLLRNEVLDELNGQAYQAGGY